MSQVSIATVSLSGSLEQKLAAAARAGFDAVEIFEPDLVASPLSARARARRGRRARPGDRDVPAPAGLRGCRPRRARAQPAPGAPQVRAHGASSAPTRCSSAPTSRADAIDDPELSAAQLHRLADEAAGVRRPDRLRGARLGLARERLPRRLATSSSWPTTRPRHLPRLLPHPLARQRPGRHRRDPRREDLLPPAGRRARDRDGRAPVEPPLPLLPRARAASTWPRSWATSGPPATRDRGRWRSSTTSSARPTPSASPSTRMRSLMVARGAVGERPLPPAPRAARPRLRRARGGLRVRRPRRRTVLEAMGFAHVGPHRSKPVHLWQQGGARVLLNHGDDRPGGRSAGGRRWASRAPIPTRSQQRAEALLASVLPRRRGPGEADLAAIAAPDDTIRLLLPHGRGARTAGSGDFVELDGARGDASVAGDRPRRALAAVRLLRRGGAVLPLGARPATARERRTSRRPTGLLRSRAVSDAVRTRAPRAHGAAAGGRRARAARRAAARGVRQRTTRSGAARRMREHGVPLLAIPDNYYDDLAARTELDDGAHRDAARARRALRRRRSGASSCTSSPRLVGDRLFFEVVERRGALRRLRGGQLARPAVGTTVRRQRTARVT